MPVQNTASLEPCGPVESSIRPPGSKSITNRAIVCAALASGESKLRGILESDDTQVMLAAWKKLGLEMSLDSATKTLTIQGCGGNLAKRSATLFVGNSGTTIRFLTAALSACEGEFELDGVERMRERPIGDLLTAIETLGGKIERLNAQRPDCPPIRILAGGLDGGSTYIRGNISSQFLSGLMMAAPLAKTDVHLQVDGELVSTPYVEMTTAVMRAFGAEVTGSYRGLISIAGNNPYHGCSEYRIEPDASAASYYWAAAAITGGRAKVEGLSRNSLQGDVGFCEVLERMGCHVEYHPAGICVEGRSLRGVDVDMANISDTVQTLAAVALFADGPTTIHGVAHNRVKETDRISDLARELVKFGAEVVERPDGLEIHPPPQVRAARVKTYDDHRMAMSLALVGLRIPGVVIEDPECTAKTYPDFWQDMSLFCGSRIHWSH